MHDRECVDGALCVGDAYGEDACDACVVDDVPTCAHVVVYVMECYCVGGVVDNAVVLFVWGSFSRDVPHVCAMMMRVGAWRTRVINRPGGLCVCTRVRPTVCDWIGG